MKNAGTKITPNNENQENSTNSFLICASVCSIIIILLLVAPENVHAACKTKSTCYKTITEEISDGVEIPRRILYTTRDFRPKNAVPVNYIPKVLPTVVKLKKKWPKRFERSFKSPFTSYVEEEIINEITADTASDFGDSFFITILIQCSFVLIKMYETEIIEEKFLEIFINLQKKENRDKTIIKILKLRGGNGSLFCLIFLKIRKTLKNLIKDRKENFKKLKIFLYENRYTLVSIIIGLILNVPITYRYRNLLKQFEDVSKLFRDKDRMYLNLKASDEKTRLNNLDLLKFGSRINEELEKYKDLSKKCQEDLYEADQELEQFENLKEKADNLLSLMEEEKSGLIEILKEVYFLTGYAAYWQKYEASFKLLNKAIQALYTLFNNSSDEKLLRTLTHLSRLKNMGPNLEIIITEIKNLKGLMDSCNLTTNDLSQLREFLKNKYPFFC